MNTGLPEKNLKKSGLPHQSKADIPSHDQALCNVIALIRKIPITMLTFKASYQISLVALATGGLSLADTTFDNIEKYAWAANTGWISFRHDRPASPAGVTFG